MLRNFCATQQVVARGTSKVADHAGLARHGTVEERRAEDLFRFTAAQACIGSGLPGCDHLVEEPSGIFARRSVNSGAGEPNEIRVPAPAPAGIEDQVACQGAPDDLGRS